MTTVASNNRIRSLALFVGLYLICLAIVFFVRPVWDVLEKLSYGIDDILNSTGIALADGELDPAGLWVIFGIPLIVAALIFFFLKMRLNRS